MVFCWSTRILVIDTDASRRIHFTSLFRYSEAAETEFFRETSPASSVRRSRMLQRKSRPLLDRLPEGLCAGRLAVWSSAASHSTPCPFCSGPSLPNVAICGLGSARPRPRAPPGATGAFDVGAARGAIAASARRKAPEARCLAVSCLFRTGDAVAGHEPMQANRAGAREEARETTDAPTAQPKATGVGRGFGTARPTRGRLRRSKPV
jgi:hypothetical protein